MNVFPPIPFKIPSKIVNHGCHPPEFTYPQLLACITLDWGNKGHCRIALHRVHEIQKLLFLKYLMVSNDFVAVNLLPQH